nr:MFS transporter [Endobacter medicaginis]MCX5474576.1 MFS transporter [Endobacter medicaginis]
MLSPALLALTIASFGIGTTEFVIMGLLPELSRDLDVSIPSAGLLVSGYALGVTVGAPLVAIATARLRRKTALVSLMGLFILGNLACALAPGYGTLMAARVLTSFCHGAFFGIAAVVAADLVERRRRAQALALVFAGLTLANVFGVPLGTAMGHAWGWRSTFLAVVAIGVLAAGAIALWLPRGAPMPAARLLGEFRVLRRPQVALTMAISTLTSVSLFSVFTYVTPMLERLAGLGPHEVTFALLAFGVGITLGNLLGGRLADWRLLPSVIGTLVVAIAVLVAFSFTVTSRLGSVATLFVWGIVVFALVPPLQYRVVETAFEAPNMASTLNQGAFNLGNALGAWFGGLMLLAFGPRGWLGGWLGSVSDGDTLGYRLLPLLGAGVAALALGLAILAWRMARAAQGGGVLGEAVDNG